jgi:uridine kinase
VANVVARAIKCFSQYGTMVLRRLSQLTLEKMLNCGHLNEQSEHHRLRLTFGASSRPRFCLQSSMQLQAGPGSESIDRLGKQGVFIVGLAGASGSGKSTVAKRVASRFQGHVISMEIYSVEMNHLLLEERAKLNYDAPHAIDVKLLEGQIRDYAAGNAIEAPIYDFAEHLRMTDRREHIPATSLLIVEGILALHFAQLRQHFDLSIYLEAPDEVCFHRRKVRDITERQRSLEFIESQYEDNVLPAARQYVLPSKRFANLVLDSAADLATVEQNLYDAIVEKRTLAEVR